MSNSDNIITENYGQYRYKGSDFFKDYESFKGIYIRYLGDIAITAWYVRRQQSEEIRDFILKNARYAWNKSMREGYKISDNWSDPSDFHSDAASQTSGIDLLISALLVSELYE